MLKLIHKWSGFDRVQKILDQDPDQDGLTFIIRNGEEFKVAPQFFGVLPNEFKSTVFLCTHHAGALDFMATYPKLAREAPPLKVVMNNQLLKLAPLAKIGIGVHALSTGKSNPEGREKMRQHLKAGGNLLVFPAGKVGHKKDGKITDYPWRKGIAQLIRNENADVVLVYVDSDNGPLFYTLREHFPKFSMLFLLKCLTGKTENKVNVYFSSKIPVSSLAHLTDEEFIQELRNRAYALPTK